MSRNRTINKFVIDSGTDPDGRKWRIIFCQHPKCGKPGKIYSKNGTWSGKHKYAHEKCKADVLHRRSEKTIHDQKKLKYGDKHSDDELDFPYFKIPQIPDIINDKEDSFSLPTKKKRTCLMCDKKFNSLGSHNRICDKCKKIQPRDEKSRKSRFNIEDNKLTDSMLIHDFYNYKVGWVTRTIEPESMKEKVFNKKGKNK